MDVNKPKYKVLKYLGESKPKNRYSIAGNTELHKGQRTLVFKKPQPVTTQSDGGLSQVSLAGKCASHFGQVSIIWPNS